MNINSKLRAFNGWFDEFILVVAKPLAMLGFAMGTVDIFVRGTLATQYWFEIAWAIVQALTIDGLFFAVWWRIFALRWESKLAGVGLVGIGLVLSIVAVATNGILGMQQLWGLPDSQRAMVRLGIDPFWFSATRALLVVAVSIMVAFVTYSSEHAEQSPEQSEQLPEQSEHFLEQSEQSVEQLEQSAEQSEQFGGTVFRISEQSPAQLPEQIAQGVQWLEQFVPPLMLTTENNDQDRVKAALSTRVKTNAPINLVEVAEETGVPYAKVRKLAPAIKKELGV